MNTSKLESPFENGTQPGGENGIGEFFSPSVLFEMNPSLRDLGNEELFELLISLELVKEWSSGGCTSH